MEENGRNFGYPVIFNKEKYQKTNDKITNIFKDYFTLINSFSYEINYIENIVNSYLTKKKFNLKKFVENQNLLIKELINIINNLLSKIQFNTNKSNSFNKNNSIKTIIRYNNTSINYLKNSIKVNDENNSLDINLATNNNTNNTHINQENNNQMNIKQKIKFNGDLSFLNINAPYKKRKKINEYINKRQGNIYNKNDLSKSSNTTNIISSKNKGCNNISHSFISNSELNKTNNNSKSLIKGISAYNNKENLKKKHNVKKYNSSDKKLLLNTSSFFSNNVKDNYNHSKTNRYKKNNSNYFSVNNGDVRINKNKTPIQITDYSSNRIYIATSTFNDSISEDIFLNKDKYKSICNNLREKNKKNNKINNLKNYEINSQYQITPNRMTKEVYNISFSILNKYEQKLKKNTSLGKRSKSLLI